MKVQSWGEQLFSRGVIFFIHELCFLYDHRGEMPPVSEYKNVKTLFVYQLQTYSLNIRAVFEIDYSNTVLSVLTLQGSRMARSTADRLGSLQ